MSSSQDILALHQALSLTGTVIGRHKLATINQLSERDAMALPSRYVDSALDDLSEQMTQFEQYDTAQLLTIAEGIECSFKERFVAGQLLGLRGDPRIKTLTPEMLVVPAATVTLGLAPEEVARVVEQYSHYGVLAEWIEKETPTFATEIKSFKLGKYCVTNQEYREFMEDTGYQNFPTTWEYGVYKAELNNHPVNTISAKDADNYCRWLSEKTGRQFRLPREAEWEYAATGGKGLEFPWGNNFVADHANTVESGILRSTPVGIFAKGAGLFAHMDLAGNVEEYVADNYAAYPGARLVVDDLLEKEGGYRIARGGSFTRFRDLARTRRRHGRYSSNLYVMGFRLAESIDE
ncbi:formylglycine-generating enzyme required for sulfatase activity [Idiomarina loihiensis]|uniref:formylglycine-generating enzyme family protein n=1 Tax=Idiomarina TaxID=135575 RepID=UPI000D715201|nr:MULTISPECIES: SUMF1/EgtB/PvdO family nonheme iron enzyme [Idiomarina]PWW40330.1 formylglycine-generating enzyme required for sulfatase activity [Idiomarina loihiensis]TDP50021.1 formylglycine-generating enzyme required for sulfatase activity [Idiomarina loihiensis]TDS24627.1 formylglycine-generating enzyme required for sulfatase activity [Idiomarina sp. H2]